MSLPFLRSPRLSSGRPWFAILLLASLAVTAPAAGFTWRKATGNARDVGVGADGSVWVVSPKVYRLSGSSWIEVGGRADNVSVDPSGTAYLANADGDLYRVSADHFDLIDGRVGDVAVGADGSLWVTGWQSPNLPLDNRDLFRRVGNTWEKVFGGVVHLAVDPTGEPWATNKKAELFRHRNGTWERLPGSGIDIGIGANGSVWIVGGTDLTRNGTTYRWENGAWVDYGGSGIRIAVGPSGDPWVVNAAGDIFHGEQLSVSVADTAALRGAALNFVLRLSGPSVAPVTVHVRTADGTATAGADYDAVETDVVFPPGSTTQSVTVPTRAASFWAPRESLTLTVVSSDNAEIPASPARGDLFSDDRQVVSPAALTIAAGVIELRVETVSGRTYTLLRRGSLWTGDWQPVSSVAGNGTGQRLTDPNPAGAEAYYRLQVDGP